MPSVAAPEAPHVFPIYDNHLILPFMCMGDEALTWSQSMADSIGGLAPGATVFRLHDDGSLSPATLGTLVCVRGECRGDHAGLAVDGGEPERKVVAVMPDDAYGSAKPFLASPTPDDCSNLPPQGNDPEGFGFPTTTPFCATYRTGDDGGMTIQIAGHGWMQENGWPVYRFFSRTVVVDHTVPWVDHGDGTSPLEPRFAWSRIDGAAHLLWIREDGIIGPQAFTLREQSVDPNGNASWVGTYQAGGQPCD